jgi:hypothetical protein
MSDNEEDVQLEALQRQLDDAFLTTRPRAGFEDDLWSRMQARRPLGVRARDFVAGLLATLRRVPGAPAAAVAVVLVLAIGVGIVSLRTPGGGGGAAGSSATSRDSQTAPLAGGPAASGAFGRLPAPALQPVPVGAAGGPKAASPAQGPTVVLYLGPANLVWAGPLTLIPNRAPVFRYQEPAPIDADRFAMALGASPTTRTADALGNYSGNGFVLGVTGSGTQPPAEPSFYLTPDRSQLPAQRPTPTATANAYLTAHKLMPAWPYVIAVEDYGTTVRVDYLRQFAVPGFGFAYAVDASGARHGLAVDIVDGQPAQVAGPLPLSLEAADYPLIPGDQALRAAVVSNPAAAASLAVTPTVRLTRLELVYALVVAGDQGFYEPAFLFSGTFTNNGVIYEKRVLVPAVAA